MSFLGCGKCQRPASATLFPSFLKVQRHRTRTMRSAQAPRRVLLIASRAACMQISELPEACVHLGAANITLAAVRDFNQGRNVQYELNVNDCRHYVNHLGHLATGAPPCPCSGVTLSPREARCDHPCDPNPPPPLPNASCMGLNGLWCGRGVALWCLLHALQSGVCLG